MSMADSISQEKTSTLHNNLQSDFCGIKIYSFCWCLTTSSDCEIGLKSSLPTSTYKSKATIALLLIIPIMLTIHHADSWTL